MGKQTHHLQFKWTESRARDTYGYNICTLYVDGVKRGCCNGGGYDMQGTSLGHWIQREFRDRLLKLKTPFYGLTFHDPNFDPGKAKPPCTPSDKEDKGKTVEQLEAEGKSLGLDRYQAFYAGSSDVPTERHTVPSIDGACGQSSVERIGNAIGVNFQRLPGRGDNCAYIATVGPMPRTKMPVGA
jgi:hypothetical protein